MNATMLFTEFLKVIEPQTICYLEHPTQKTHSNSKDYKKFEITDTNEVKCEINFYKESVELSLENGYKLLRGPLFIQKYIENGSK
jgi:hypothetical protein